jgi:hypothetical protein
MKTINPEKLKADIIKGGLLNSLPATLDGICMIIDSQPNACQSCPLKDKISKKMADDIKFNIGRFRTHGGFRMNGDDGFLAFISSLAED